MPSINIVCFKWGNWPVEYVYKLRNMLSRHLTLPYHFYCFSDQKVKGIDTIIMPKHILSWKKNFPKFYVYSKDNGLTGRTIMIDLDSVIVDNLDEMFSFDGDWCGISPLGTRPTNNRGGGLVSFDQDKFHWLYDDMEANVDQYTKDYRGNERFVYELFFSETPGWQALYPGYLQSYKWGIRKDISPEIKFIAFHGSPRPHEVDDAIIVANWK